MHTLILYSQISNTEQNFAASGSTIQPVDSKLFGAGFNPLSLNIQLSQFEQLKERSMELYNQG